MPLPDSAIQVFAPIPIELHYADVLRNLPSSVNIDTLLKPIEDSLEALSKVWHPRALLRWLAVEKISDTNIVLLLPENKTQTSLALGFSSRFMKQAKYGMIAIYTVGQELEKAAMTASSEKRHLDSYLYNLIGLTVLEKIGDCINKIVESQAFNLDWKVGPFLSPGSVHGWELHDQRSLCSLLPVQDIDVQCAENGVFHPFNTISCLIGIGPNYSTTTVGSSCQVCSNYDQCEIREIRQNGDENHA